MVVSLRTYLILLSLLIVERFFELNLARRNARRAFARGAVEVGQAHYRVMVALHTAFIASCVIGVFESSIGKLVALAALMPIIAGIGGNSGNQTITMIVRALALGEAIAVPSLDTSRELEFCTCKTTVAK